MKINELETILDVPRATIRYYEKEGLISPQREENGYREYSDEDLRTLRAIIVLRKIGVSLSEIHDLIDGDTDLDTVLDNNLSRLEQEKSELAAAMKICREIRSDDADFGSMDSERYLTHIHDLENKGVRFYELAKEFAVFHGDEMRERGFLPKDPGASTIKKLLYFTGSVLLFFTLNAVIRVLNSGWEIGIRSTAVTTALFLALMFFCILSDFFMKKRFPKYYRRGLSLVIIFVLSMIVISVYHIAWMHDLDTSSPGPLVYRGKDIHSIVQYETPEGFRELPPEELFDDDSERYTICLDNGRYDSADYLLEISVASYQDEGVAVRDDVPVDMDYLINAASEDSILTAQEILERRDISGYPAVIVRNTWDLGSVGTLPGSEVLSGQYEELSCYVEAASGDEKYIIEIGTNNPGKGSLPEDIEKEFYDLLDSLSIIVDISV